MPSNPQTAAARTSKLPRAPGLRAAGLLACLAVVVPAAAVTAQGMKAAAGKVDFTRDVQPILAQNCYACHGFDAAARKASLRLDDREGSRATLPSGNRAIVPGDAEASLLVRRTANHSMPPVASGKRLSPAQIDLLRRWVEQGAPYAEHWAFVPPVRPDLPPVRLQGWAINPIDRFLLARMESAGLRPSPPADRVTLIRRVTLDLTGLPPTPAEVNAFLGDHEPGAYERVVDRLLQSPHYGEKMAVGWLDLARYADTHGYHIDSHRDMWPWRDWVIRAFNQNLPYDQFVVHQLAGDLLPNATLEQRVATGFNRNHPINFEGGAIPEEYLANYIFDRVDTTATAFMGLTMRCAQCHDHKYDPLTQREFYRFYAYFHNNNEAGLDGTQGNARPFLKVPSPEQDAELKRLAARIGELDARAKAAAAAAAPMQPAWEQSVAAEAAAPGPVPAGLTALYRLEGDAAAFGELAGPETRAHGRPAWVAGRSGQALRLDGETYLTMPGGDFERDQPFSYGGWVQLDDAGQMALLSKMDQAAGARGWDLYFGEGKVFVHLVHQWEGDAIRVNTKTPLPLKSWQHVFVTYDGSGKAAGLRVYLNGRRAEVEVTHDTLRSSIRTPVPLTLGRRTAAAPFRGLADEIRIYDRQLAPEEVLRLADLEGLRDALAIPAERRSPEQRSNVRTRFLETGSLEYAALAAELAEVRRKHEELDRSIPTTMVMEELPKPRDTFLLVRGQYDRPGEKVAPGTPAVLPPLPGDAPPNRLALARWLTDPRHPLTARVAVNRFWLAYFGQGLVRTPENFGTQGDPPTHPELLDWLATEFLRTGWDVKALQRLIVTSATYRQSSAVSPGLRARDPENRLYARGPRHRLKAEFLRDQALAVSGLLVRKIGGPSVKPYQPAGLWEELAFGGNFTAQTYVQDHGENLYRRSLYTFWKRTCPPPSLQTLDAPEREVCVVARSTTNTPLQALVLLNDPTFVEASRHLAQRVLTEVAALPRDRIRYLYRLVLGRQPTGDEIRTVESYLLGQLDRYGKNPEAARKLLAVGESPRNEALPAPVHAAWTDVALLLLNTDEAVTKG